MPLSHPEACKTQNNRIYLGKFIPVALTTLVVACDSKEETKTTELVIAAVNNGQIIDMHRILKKPTPVSKYVGPHWKKACYASA